MDEHLLLHCTALHKAGQSCYSQHKQERQRRGTAARPCTAPLRITAGCGPFLKQMNALEKAHRLCWRVDSISVALDVGYAGQDAVKQQKRCTSRLHAISSLPFEISNHVLEPRHECPKAYALQFLQLLLQLCAELA